MDQSTKPLYAALLERAGHNLRMGFLNTARMLAADALDEMVPTFSPNNPRLADAYRLHARICLTHFRAAGYLPSNMEQYQRNTIAPRLGRFGKRIDAAGLFSSWGKSALAEIEVLSLGMDTERLAQAKFDYELLLSMSKDTSARHHQMEAIQMKARLADVTVDDAFIALSARFAQDIEQMCRRADAMEPGSLTG